MVFQVHVPNPQEDSREDLVRGDRWDFSIRHYSNSLVTASPLRSTGSGTRPAIRDGGRSVCADLHHRNDYLWILARNSYCATRLLLQMFFRNGSAGAQQQNTCLDCHAALDPPLQDRVSSGWSSWMCYLPQ